MFEEYSSPWWSCAEMNGLFGNEGLPHAFISFVKNFRAAFSCVRGISLAICKW
jgi:hypothetical protein